MGMRYQVGMFVFLFVIIFVGLPAQVSAETGVTRVGSGLPAMSASTLERIDAQLQGARASVEKSARRLGEIRLLLVAFILLNIAQIIMMVLGERDRISVLPASSGQAIKKTIAFPIFPREKVRFVVGSIAGVIILLVLTIFVILAIWS